MFNKCLEICHHSLVTTREKVKKDFCVGPNTGDLTTVINTGAIMTGATGGDCLLPPSRPHLLSNWERVLVFIGANTEHQEITDLL